MFPGTVLMIVMGGVLASTVVAQDPSVAEARLSSKSSEARRSAVHELRTIGTEAASRAALPALRDANVMVRAAAAAAVIHLPPFEAVEALTPLLSDRAELVRREAAFALGGIGGSGSVPPLVARLGKERSEAVRSAIVIAIGNSGEVQGLPALVEVLREKPTEANDFTRRSSARAVGRIAQKLRTGRTDRTSPQNFLPGEFKDDMAERGLEAPADFGEASRELRRVVSDPNESDDVRREGVYALGAIGDASAGELLEPLTRSTDPYMSEIAKEAIRRLIVLPRGQ